MKILIDMNISPNWVDVFHRCNWEAAHWSAIGNPNEKDPVIMDWARSNGYVVFTHDLDFGALLASTRATGPSVIQIRTQDIMSEQLKKRILPILQQYENLLERGVLLTIDESKSRVRILPFEDLKPFQIL